MPSSNDGRTPRKESSAAQQSSNWDADPPSPPPTTSYPTQAASGPAYPPPHMMYYPPPMGYPPGHGGQHHHAYPQAYAPYPNPNEYPLGNPPGYNYPVAQYYGNPPPYRSAGFFRGFILCTCVMFLGFFLASFIVAMLLSPKLPVYNVVSLSVANFNTTPALADDWDAGITIENPNDKLMGYFSELKVEVVYRSFGVVAVSYAPGFELDAHEKKQMAVKASNHSNQMALEKSTLDEMGKDRATGSVTFSLRISSAATFRSASMATRPEVIVAICQDLKVVFHENNNTGTLDNGGKPVICVLSL